MKEDPLAILLREVIDIIDFELGAKYAIKNPRLVAELVRIKSELQKKAQENDDME